MSQAAATAGGITTPPISKAAKLALIRDRFGLDPDGMTPIERKTAISGYDLKHRIEAMVSAITRKKIEHVYKGDGAATAPGLMILPRIVATSLFPMRHVRILLGYTAHEISHQLKTDFNLLQELIDNPGYTDRKKQQIKEFWNAIEDYRIEKLVKKDYPGFHVFIDDTRDFSARRFCERVDAGLFQAKDLANPYRIGSVALTWVGAILNKYMTKAPREALDRLDPNLTAWIESWAPDMEKVETCQDALDLAIEVLEELDKMRQQGDSSPEGDDEPEEGSEPSKNQQSNCKSKNKSSSGETDDDSAYESSQEESSDQSGNENSDKSEETDDAEKSESEDNDEEDSSDSSDSKSSSSSNKEDESDPDNSDENKSSGDQESDEQEDEGNGENSENSNSSNNSNDDLESEDDAEGKSEDPKDKKPSPGSKAKPRPQLKVNEGDQDAASEEADLEIDDLKKAINSIKGEEAQTPDVFDENNIASKDAKKEDVALENIRRGQGEYTQIKKSVSAPAARAAGILRRLLQSTSRKTWQGGKEEGELDFGRIVGMTRGDQDVYRQRQIRESVNTAVSLLLDNSGSMTGAPITICQQTAVVLDMAIQGTKTNVEINGFTNDFTGKPRLYRYRAFGQKGQAASASLGNMHTVQLGGTPVSTPLLESWRRLCLQKEPRRIMIVVSDGGADYNDVKAARNAHDFIVKQGCTIIGISIGCESEMKAWCDNVQAISDISELPIALTNLVKEALK